MQIENESQWNTEDLVALTKAVAAHANINLDTEDSLLVFKTSRRFTRRRRRYGAQPNEKEEVVIDKAATTGYYRGIGGGAKVVEIYSKDKLIEKNVLDRLGAVTLSDVRQDIHPKWIRDIAVAISSSLTGSYYYNRDDDEVSKKFEWAEKFQLRAASKITRSKLILEKKVQELLNERARVERSLQREMEKYDNQIEKLRAKIRGE